MRGLKEKLVDYTESSDEMNENCQINVDEDCTTDRPNLKDPMISGVQRGGIHEDIQPSSDAEEREQMQKKSDPLFSSDEENRSSYPIVQEILENWEDHEQKQKDELVLRSQEAFRLDNKDKLLSDDIHKNVVVVSATGEEVNPAQIESTSTSDTTISTTNTASDSDSEPELTIIRRKKKAKK